MTNEIKQEIQLAILGKSLVNKEVLNKMLEAVSTGKMVFTDKCQDLYFAIANSMVRNGMCDALSVIEILNDAHIKDSVLIVRRAIDESKLLNVEDVMIEIKKIITPDIDDKQLFTDTERLKMLNNELLEVAAECIANKHVKKIEISKKKEDTYIVRLKGGLTAVFQQNMSPSIYLTAGNDISRFPMSYKFVVDLYNELHSVSSDDETHETQHENCEQTVEPIKKPKSFFEKFLK